MDRARLTRYAWLSIFTAVATIGLKTGAYFITGSISLLSDAVESLVNVIGAVMALSMLIVAARPPDEDHLYGHSKAEYLASWVEGGLILVAGLGISATAVSRLIWPRELSRPLQGLVASSLALCLNLITARILINAGKRHNSIALEADGKHLMSDVWSSVAVIAGVAAVAATGWNRLDAIVAIAVSSQILRYAYQILHASITGLMDTTLPVAQQEALHSVLDRYRQFGMQFHSIKTRRSAACSFIDLHVLVPGQWTVHDGHHLLEQIESDIRQVISDATVHTHIEPIEDPISFHPDGPSQSS